MDVVPSRRFDHELTGILRPTCGRVINNLSISFCSPLFNMRGQYITNKPA